MHLKNLKVFCDVVARHSFSKAAQDNDMTQSGASQAVQQLEEYLHVQLIDRSKRPFVLTAEGDAFHRGCLKVLRSFDSLTDEVRSMGNAVAGKTSIASIYSVGLSYLPDIKKSVSEQFSKVQGAFSVWSSRRGLPLGRAGDGRLWAGELRQVLEVHYGNLMAARADDSGFDGESSARSGGADSAK